MRVETIGDATLILDDCLEWLSRVPPCFRVDAVVTDPPYGIGFPYHGYDDTRDNLKRLISGFMPAARTIADRTVVLPGITQIALYPECDWIVCVHWNTTGSFGKFGYTQWMPVLVYGEDLKGFGNVNGVTKSDRIAISGGNGVGFRREDVDHTCPKPENVMQRVTERLTAVGDVVLDPFMGSGTTGVACANLGRKFIGIEIEPKYFDIACERIDNAYRQARMFA